jgi:hypothetical protein
MRGLGITLGNVVSYNSLLDAMARAAGPHTPVYAEHALRLLVRPPPPFARLRDDSERPQSNAAQNARAVLATHALPAMAWCRT